MTKEQKVELTDEHVMEAIASIEKGAAIMANRRLVMVSYHKWNPIYLYKLWRGKRRRKSFVKAMLRAVQEDKR